MRVAPYIYAYLDHSPYSRGRDSAMFTRKKLLVALAVSALLLSVRILLLSAYERSASGPLRRPRSRSNAPVVVVQNEASTADHASSENSKSSKISLISTSNYVIGCNDTNATIHVAIPLHRTADALLVLKSLLLHRSSPLHVHLISPSHFATATNKLMSTWRLPEVHFTVYDIDIQHTSSYVEFSSSLVKLLITSILPEDINKVIYIDTGILITANIKDLWMQFFMKKNLDVPFGVNSLQDDFCATNPSIILLNLKAMRKSHWNANVTDSNWPQGTNPTTQLCNVAKRFKHFDLSCSWNVNLYTEKLRSECYDITHGDHKALDSSSNSFRNLQFFKSLEEYIMHYDGSFLKYVSISCGKLHGYFQETDKTGEYLTSALKKNDEELIYQLVRSQSHQVFRTVLYYYGGPYTPKEDHETTLVTQISLDRLQMFRTLVEQWDGPMSISMYGTDMEAWKLKEFISLIGLFSKRDNINIHIVYKQGELYPVNHLRNIALDAVSTPYVFLSDADFIPVEGLFSYLQKTVAAYHLDEGTDHETALVIPAFETENMKFKVPKTKKALLKFIRNKSVFPLCEKCLHKSHTPTNYHAWYKANKLYEVKWEPFYEPYVVVKSDVARYDERFIGYGFNKVSQLTILKAEGYRFVVLPDVFVIHLPHPRTIDKLIWINKSFQNCMNSIYEEFLVDVRKKYGKNCLDTTVN